MAERARLLVRGVSSLLALVVLTVGPPAALSISIGWPLPEGLPSLDEFTTGAHSGIDPMVIVKTLAILGWLAWAQIALAVAAEAAALARRTPAPSLPVLPSVQLGVGHLLAGTVLLFASFGSTRPAYVPLVAAEPITDIAPGPLPAPPPPAATSTAADLPGVSEDPATIDYRVQRNDSWWQISESTLGDGLLWRQIRDLNVGRTMTDGTTITAQTEILHEGWTILVPGEPDGAEDGFAPIPEAIVVVERGDNLWDLAEDHLEEVIDRQAGDAEIGPYWLDVIEENRPRLADPANPSLIHPGQHLRLPARGDHEGPDGGLGSEPPSSNEPAHPVEGGPAAGPEPTSHTPGGAPAAPADPAPATTAPATTAGTGPPPPATADPEPPTGEKEDDDLLPAAGLLGTAGTLLAVGLSAAVLRRRRRSEQQLGPGTRLPDPPASLDELRSEISARADTDHIDLLDHALASAASALSAHVRDARIRVAQASNGRVELLLSEPVLPAPEGWRPEASGSAWILEQSAVTDDHDRSEAASTHPLLVSLGRADTYGQLYLDLEAEGLIELHGPEGAVAGLLRSLLLELATSPLAAGTSIYLCGDVPGAPEARPDRTIRVETWDSIADSALAWAQQTRDLQAAHRWTTPPAGRIRSDRAGDLAPLVIVLGEHPDDERFASLCRTIGESIIPVVVVAAGIRIDGATRIEVDGDGLHLPSLGLSCAAQQLDERAADEVAELLDVSNREPEQLELTDPEPATGSNGHHPRPLGRYADPPHDVLVRVLGDIEVIGGNEPLTPKPTAIVTFLALHNPATAERIEDAIWSGPADNRRKRLINNMSETRAALGAEHLPPSQDGKYRLGPGVVTDLELLERRMHYAAAQEGDAATEALRGALDLVAGPVFTYRNADRHAYAWVDTGNWISSAELKVTTLAEDLAQRYLDAGDVGSAVWAASRGLAAVPTHSRLTGLLMQAHVADCDPRAALTVYESHTNALVALDLDEVDPDLADLYGEIRARWREGARDHAGSKP